MAHRNRKMGDFTRKILKNPPPKKKDESERDKFNKEVKNILKKKSEEKKQESEQIRTEINRLK